MEAKIQAKTDTGINLPLLTIEQYCNECSIDDRYSFVYCKSFASMEAQSKQDWDLFLQNHK